MIMFQFEVPKSSLYDDAGSKNYDDKIKVFVHDITAQVRTLPLSLSGSKNDHLSKDLCNQWSFAL